MKYCTFLTNYFKAIFCKVPTTEGNQNNNFKIRIGIITFIKVKNIVIPNNG